MQIVQTAQSIYYGHVLLQGLPTVFQAVHGYFGHLAEQCAQQHDGLVATRVREEAKALVRDASPALKTKDRWNGQLNAPSTRQLEITVLDRERERCALSIDTDLYSEEDRILAQLQGVPVGLRHAWICWYIKPGSPEREHHRYDTGFFHFDFDEVILKLKPLLPLQNVTGAAIAAGLMQVTELCTPGNHCHSFRVYADEHIAVDMEPQHFVMRECKSGEKPSLIDGYWEAKGSVLRGVNATCPLNERPYTPRIEIYIRSKKGPAIFDPEQQRRVVDLANQIETSHS